MVLINSSIIPIPVRITARVDAVSTRIYYVFISFYSVSGSAGVGWGINVE